MDWFYYILFWVCIVGLCVGSFANVVILRSLSGESIVFPPSKCPKCGHKLYFWHNIPVLSYILLRGKCYFCKEKISIQYPVIEIITMFLFVLSFLKFGIGWSTLFCMFWLTGLLIMTATDIKEKLVDCNIAIAICITGLIHAFIYAKWIGVLYSGLGLLAGALLFFAIAKIGKLIAKKDVLGEADMYVAGALGSMFGIVNLITVLILGLFAYAIIVVPMFLYNKFKQKDIFTCLSGLLFAISIAIFLFFRQNYYTLCLIVLFGAAFIYFMFKGVKSKNEGIYVPYVPAFAIGTLLFILFYI